MRLAGLGVSVCCSAQTSSWVILLPVIYLVPQLPLLSLAGRIVALVVVPGVLVAVAAVLRLLETNHNRQKKGFSSKQSTFKMLLYVFKSHSYLVPAAVSSIAGLSAHVGAHHRRRGRGDGDVRHGRRDL